MYVQLLRLRAISCILHAAHSQHRYRCPAPALALPPSPLLRPLSKVCTATQKHPQICSYHRLSVVDNLSRKFQGSSSHVMLKTRHICTNAHTHTFTRKNTTLQLQLQQVQQAQQQQQMAKCNQSEKGTHYAKMLNKTMRMQLCQRQ